MVGLDILQLQTEIVHLGQAVAHNVKDLRTYRERIDAIMMHHKSSFPMLFGYEDIFGKRHLFSLHWWQKDDGTINLKESSSYGVRAAAAALTGQKIDSSFMQRLKKAEIDDFVKSAKKIISPGAPGMQLHMRPFESRHYAMSSDMQKKIMDAVHNTLSETDFPQWARDSRLLADANIMFVSPDIMESMNKELSKDLKFKKLMIQSEGQSGFQVIPGMSLRTPNAYESVWMIADNTAAKMSAYVNPIQYTLMNMDWDADITKSFAFSAEAHNLTSLAKQTLAFARHKGITGADEWLEYHRRMLITRAFGRLDDINMEEIQNQLNHINLKTLTHKDTGQLYQNEQAIFWEMAHVKKSWLKDIPTDTILKQPLMTNTPVELLNYDQVYARIVQRDQSKLLMQEAGTIRNLMDAYNEVLFFGQGLDKIGDPARFKAKTDMVIHAMNQMAIDAAKPRMMQFPHKEAITLWTDMMMNGNDNAEAIIRILNENNDAGWKYLPKELKEHLPILSRLMVEKGGLRTLNRKGYDIVRGQKNLEELDIYIALKRARMYEKGETATPPGYLERILSQQVQKAKEAITPIDLGVPRLTSEEAKPWLFTPMEKLGKEEKEELRAYLHQKWIEGQDIRYGRYIPQEKPGTYKYQHRTISEFIDDLLRPSETGEKSKFSQWQVKQIIEAFSPEFKEPGSTMVYLPVSRRKRDMIGNLEFLRGAHNEYLDTINRYARQLKDATGNPIVKMIDGQATMNTMSLTELTNTMIGEQNRDIMTGLRQEVKRLRDTMPGSPLYGGVNASIPEKGVALYRHLNTATNESFALDVANHLTMMGAKVNSRDHALYLQWTKEQFTMINVDEVLANELKKRGSDFPVTFADSEYAFIIPSKNKLMSDTLNLTEEEAKKVQIILAETEGNIVERQKRIQEAVSAFKKPADVGMGTTGSALRPADDIVSFKLIPGGLGKKPMLGIEYPVGEKHGVHGWLKVSAQQKILGKAAPGAEEFTDNLIDSLMATRGLKDPIIRAQVEDALRTKMEQGTVVLNFAHIARNLEVVEDTMKKGGATVPSMSGALGKFSPRVVEAFGVFQISKSEAVGPMGMTNIEGLPLSIQEFITQGTMTQEAAAYIRTMGVTGDERPNEILKAIIDRVDARDYKALQGADPGTAKKVAELSTMLRKTHQETFDLIMAQNDVIDDMFYKMLNPAPRVVTPFKSNIRDLAHGSLLKDVMSNRNVLFAGAALLGGALLFNTAEMVGMKDLAHKGEQRQENALLRDYYTSVGLEDPRVQKYDSMDVDTERGYLRYVMTGIGGHAGQMLAKGGAVARHPKGLVTIYASKEGSGYFKPLRRKRASLLEPQPPRAEAYRYNTSINQRTYIDEYSLRDTLKSAL